MSARIHEIAKQYNIEPKEMLAWLKQQGFVAADTKSAAVFAIATGDTRAPAGRKNENGARKTPASVTMAPIKISKALPGSR